MNIRVEAAARYVGLSKSSLDKLRCYGGGPNFFKVGSAVIYSTADLDLWLAGKRSAGNDNQRIASAA